MKLKIMILSVLIVFGLTGKVFAVEKKDTAKMMKDIFAGKTRIYFDTVHGWNNKGFVEIEMQRNEQVLPLELIDSVVDKIIKNTWDVHRYAKGGRIIIHASSVDLWDTLVVRFDRRGINLMQYTPSLEEAKERIAARKQPPSTKFGLSEEQRKEFSYKHDELVSWVKNQAVKKYPYDENRQLDYEDEIFYPKEVELMNEYGLTKDQGYEIIYDEAMKKKWYK